MKSALLSLLALALAGCAAANAQQERSGGRQSDRDCFSTASVSGYGSIDRDTGRLDVGPRRRYEVDISGPGCDQIDWTLAIALESRPSSFICTGDRPGQGRISFRDPGSSWRTSCLIDNVRRLPEPARD